MSDAGETSVVFERDTTDTSTDQTMMDGDVILNPGNYQVAASEQYPMEIRIDGTNFYQKSYTIKSMTGNNGWIKSADSQTYRYKISLQGLKANSYYTISVWGYAETVPGTGTYMYRNLGSYVAATTKLDPVKVEMAPATGSGSALGTYIYLGPANDETDPENYSTTLKSIKAVEVKLYLGATPSKDDSNRIGNKDEEIMAVSDRSQPGVPYTNVIASTYYGKKGRDTNLIYVDESTFGLTSASLTASQYCIKVSAIYDYTKYYPYDEDGENENIGKYANEIPFTEDSTTSLPISVVNRLPDFPNPQNNGVQATPIKYSDLQGLGIRYTANDKDQYQDDTIVGYTLQANYDNSGDMGQSVTYYAFTQADLNEYNAQTSLDRGDDVMSWREKQTSRTTPWMKLTLPIAAKSLMPPAVRILFMEPTDVIGANKNVADITGTLNDTEKAANQAAVNGVAAQYMDGSTQTFFAPGLERGWHYIFAYQTRLYYQGSYAYVYPNGYTGRFLSGQTLLNSGIQDTPKQKTVLTMSLDHNTLSNNLTEHNKGIGQVVWNYNYTDLDGSIPTGNDGGLFAAWNTLSEGSSSILDSSTTDSKTNTQGQVVINTAGSMAYKINMRQKLYQAGDRYSATDTEEPKEVEVSAVNHTYTRPIDERDLRDNVMNVTIPESNKGNVATFSFNFDNDISDQMTTRLTRLVIRACDSQGEVNGSAQSYDKFDGTNVDGHPYVTYDLSKAGAAGKQVTFKAQMYYDSGYMGIKELDQNNPDQVLALQNATTGRYIVWRYEYVGNNMYPLNQNNTKENAGWSEYKISTTAPTSDQDLKATTAWKLQNLHNQKPSGADPADYPDPVMNLKESAGGLMDVETRGLYPIIKRVDHKELPLLDTQNRTKYITIPSLTPSVSNWWMVAGLTTIDSTFTTNSYDMIQETTPKDPVTGKNMKSGRYVHMVVREVLNNGTISTSITQQVYLEMSQQDTAKTYRYTFEGLEPGKTYAVELWCMQAGSTDTNETLFWNTTSGAQGEAARKNITLYKEMKINDPAVTEIEYKSYMEKTLTLTYNMDLASGFEIQYSIGKKNSDGSETPLLDHAGVMDLMGYQLNENNEWVKKSNPNAKWTLGVNMMETLTFEPKANATVVPGGNYVIHIVAKDSHQAQLGEGKVNFTWPPLVDPTFYVESTTINDGNRLRISFNPVDTNKVIAGGQYYAVVWGPENQIVAIQKCDVQAGVQSLTVDVEQKYQGKSYKVSFYAVTDMTNTWKDGLDIGSIDDNHKDQAAAILKGMTPLYETVQKTLQSWGGRYSKVMFVFNSSRSLLVYMYDASGLENITKVEVTLYRDGKTRNYVVTKPTNKSLFDLIPGSAVNYQTVIPTEETEQGSYKILRANFYTSRSDTEPQFYESGDAVLQ